MMLLNTLTLIVDTLKPRFPKTQRTCFVDIMIMLCSQGRMLFFFKQSMGYIKLQKTQVNVLMNLKMIKYFL